MQKFASNSLFRYPYRSMAKDSSARGKRSVSGTPASDSKVGKSVVGGAQAGSGRGAKASSTASESVVSARTPSRLPKIEPRGTIKVGKVTQKEAGSVDEKPAANKPAAPKPAVKVPEVKVPAKPVAKLEGNSESKPQVKSQAGPQAGPQARPQVKPQTKPTAAVEPKATNAKAATPAPTAASVAAAAAHAMPESTRRAIAAATPRQQSDEPPARQGRPSATVDQ